MLQIVCTLSLLLSISYRLWVFPAPCRLYTPTNSICINTNSDTEICYRKGLKSIRCWPYRSQQFETHFPSRIGVVLNRRPTILTLTFVFPDCMLVGAKDNWLTPENVGVWWKDWDIQHSLTVCNEFRCLSCAATRYLARSKILDIC